MEEIVTDLTNEIASKHLGKRSLGSESYDPSLIVAIPRILNREQYSIENENLPFKGFDVWHAYEFSSLTENGIPVTRVLKLKYSCESEFLIESKSLKLYLNSFNMSRFGKTRKECLQICKAKIEKDLSERLQTLVEANFLENSIQQVEIFSDFKNIMDSIDDNSLKVDCFKETPDILETEILDEKKSYKICFDSLRSNCRVTHQPDFGEAFIYYSSQNHIIETSLIKYLSSFRSEYHFHEECCEMIFKRLKDLLNSDDELFVCALYTRRGGIDICPARWSKNIRPDEIDHLLDISTYASKNIKQ